MTSVSSVVAGYRPGLEALAEGGAVERHLDAWAAERGLGTGLGWRREYGRFRPGRVPWAVLAYGAEGGRITVRVDVRGDLSTTAQPGQDLDHRPDALEVHDCRDDGALPGLATVLDALPDSVVVRYRPGSRCTVRGGTGAYARFVKVMTGEPDTQVDARALWAASQQGSFDFAVAEPCGWDRRTRSSWYGVVPGAPVASALLGPDGAATARRIGVALGELARARLRPARAEGPAGQLARTGRAVQRAAAAAPELADLLDRALRVLAGLHDSFRARPLVPVHGSPHMHQWLEDASGRLGLVDFDRFSLGEPELDLATFLVELESESRRTVPMVGLSQALCSGFEGAARPIDETRLAVYGVHKRLAKVARTACGLRPDGAARAARHLDSLDEDLALLDRRATSRAV